jgi:uncharacterized protein YggU (UPF0235/DUF167 family)
MYINVRVKTGQKKEIVEQLTPSRFSISVKEKAERNSANARVVKIIAERLGVPAKKVRIVNGHRIPSKMLSVTE